MLGWELNPVTLGCCNAAYSTREYSRGTVVNASSLLTSCAPQLLAMLAFSRVDVVPITRAPR